MESQRENNAHPHLNANVGVVHNGIIENFRELRDELQAKGHEFSTETDSEVIAHLVSDAHARLALGRSKPWRRASRGSRALLRSR